MGKVAAWQRALSGAELERAGAAEHGRLVIGLVHAQHARGRAAVGDADAAGRLHARQRAGTRRCRSRRSAGHSSLARGEAHPRCAWPQRLCVCAQPETLIAKCRRC